MAQEETWRRNQAQRMLRKEMGEGQQFTYRAPTYTYTPLGNIEQLFEERQNRNGQFKVNVIAIVMECSKPSKTRGDYKMDMKIWDGTGVMGANGVKVLIFSPQEEGFPRVRQPGVDIIRFHRLLVQEHNNRPQFVARIGTSAKDRRNCAFVLFDGSLSGSNTPYQNTGGSWTEPPNLPAVLASMRQLSNGGAHPVTGDDKSWLRRLSNLEAAKFATSSAGCWRSRPRRAAPKLCFTSGMGRTRRFATSMHLNPFLQTSSQRLGAGTTCLWAPSGGPTWIQEMMTNGLFWEPRCLSLSPNPHCTSPNLASG
eukprot:jgi/Botrbrau1/9411/Bobra.0252s0036.1